MALAILIVGPAKPLIDVGPDEIVADGMDGLRTKPGVVAEGLVPAAGEDVVLAVRAVDDLPVPVVPEFHGGVFKTVLQIARADGGHTPGCGRERGEDRRGQEIVDEGLASCSGGLRGPLSGGRADSGYAEEKGGERGDEKRNSKR